ncbi:M48 family metallopeptidase [Palaeococcus pacificus]|nr:M48 family metalloprotease [Palaeococcus pacificus]
MTLLSTLVLVAIYFWITKNSLKKGHTVLKYEEMPWLYDAVARMAKKANIKTPKIYILEDYIPNAYSFGNSIVLSLGLFEVLQENEILGVAAHEVGHIKNKDTLLFPIVSYGRYWMMTLSLLLLLSTNVHAILGSLVLCGLYEAQRLRFFKEREFLADEAALHILDRPFDLKDALEEIKYYEDLRIKVKESALPGIEPNIERKQKRTFMETHPSYDERIWKILIEVGALEIMRKLK